MFEERPDAGTPLPEPDDSENAGTPEVVDDSETEGDEVKPVDGKLAMSWKAKAERVNEVERELAQLRAEKEQRTTTDTRGSEATEARESLEDQQAEVAKQEAYISRLEAAAKAGNEDAAALVSVHKASLRNAKQALAAEERTVYRLEMSDVPENKRDAVRAEMARRPGLKSPALAYTLLKGDEHGTLAQEVVQLKKELEELKRPRQPVERRIPGASKAASAANGEAKKSSEEYLRDMATNPDKAIADRKAGKYKF
jgi:DNA repair exonuclease SbcCD ATPase subunit